QQPVILRELMIHTRDELICIKLYRGWIAVKASRTIGGGHRIALQEVEGDRIEPIRRNHISGEWLFGGWVRDRSGTRKIAGLLRRRQGKIAQCGGGAPFFRALPGEEEECLIPHDRTAESHTILVSLEGRRFGRKEGAAIEDAVA